MEGDCQHAGGWQRVEVWVSRGRAISAGSALHKPSKEFKKAGGMLS